VAQLLTRTLAERMLRRHLAPETMQPGQTMLSSAWPTRGVRPAMSGIRTWAGAIAADRCGSDHVSS